jgi:hypothetical protein
MTTTLVLAIDRTSLSLGTLSIAADPSSGYILETFGPGRRQWDRATAESPWVHGRALTGSRMLQGELTGVVCVYADAAASAATLGTRLDALVDALSQFSYTVTFTHTEGVTSQAWTWTCEPADLDIGDAGLFADDDLAALIQPVAFRIPRSPIPLAGPI